MLVVLATLMLCTWLLPINAGHIEVALSIPAATAERPTWGDQRQAFSGRLVRGYGLDEAVADEFAAWILEASTRQRLAPELIASLVMTESSFRKDARSHVGAVGPAQVQPDLWSNFCGADLHNPEENIYCGAQILAHYENVCRRESDTLEAAKACALRSYNAGFHNQDNVYFKQVHKRYAAKIDRYRSPLIEAEQAVDVPS